MPVCYPIPLSIVVLTGETSAGKSIFGTLSTPNAIDLAKPPQSVVFDHEGSMEPYVGALNFAWKDVRQACAAGVHRQIRKADAADEEWKKVLLEKAETANSLAAATFRATALGILGIEPGQFLVGQIDTFSPLQQGATEWLEVHPSVFGRTTNQYTKAKSMFLIPDVRRLLDELLAVECRKRFEMTVLTYHQKNEWEGSGDSAHKTGQRISEAWELADRLATLYATLDRRPKAKGKSAPRVPSALLVWPYGKSRLMVLKNGKLLPALPPRMPEFTPEAIRAYIANPPDYDALKIEERMPDDSLTADQVLLVQDRIATNQRVTEELKHNALELARQAAERGRLPAIPPPGTTSAIPAASQPLQATPPAEKPATPAQFAEIRALLAELFPDPADKTHWLGTRNVKRPDSMSEADAMGTLSELLREKSRRAMPAPLENDRVTQQQRDTIRNLTQARFGENAGTIHQAWLLELGVGSPMGLSYGQAQNRINQLERMGQGPNVENAVPVDDIPF